MQKGNYSKFASMLAGSFVLMYGIMYLNVDLIDHVYLNMTRFYMTLLMVSAMALLMLWMMNDVSK